MPSRGPIDHPADSPDIAYCVGTDLLADGVDQEFDGVAFNFLVPAIDVPLEISAGQNDAWAAHQRLQQGEFACRQEACVFAVADFKSRGIEADAAVAQDRRCAAALPAQDRAHPRKQLARLERL